MNKPGKRLPKFASEEAEHKFRAAHDSTDHLDWSKAQRARFAHLKPSTQSISLRLPAHMLERIKAAANARDVPYQSLIKVWLEEKLSSGASQKAQTRFGLRAARGAGKAARGRALLKKAATKALE
jgi:predicted DNA binding CopG/RHH family protein